MTKNTNYTTKVALVVGAIIFGFILGNLITSREATGHNGSLTKLLESYVKPNSKISEILQMIDKDYVDTVDIHELTEEVAIDMIARLDPHSVYIPAEDLEFTNSELEGSFTGIGIQFNIQQDTITVVSVISGGPSEKAGLLAGDRIILVNDSNFVGKHINNEKVLKELRGPKDTQVTLGVARRSAKETLHYTITRGYIPVHSIDISYMLTPEIGIIKVNKFGEATYSEFLTAIAKLKKEGASKFVIDLRENSGGYLDRAIAMVNEFLPANQLIVYTEGRAYPTSEARSDGTGSCINNPMIVLIDEFSASASEIFAGAIQDNDRGLIIGRRSFGKGLVQQQKKLSDGSAIRLTVANYYTPSGRSIQKPYAKGDSEEYNKDIYNRFVHGEFYTQDSIKQNDTIEYKTLAGRTVYGGGGIMPDIFIARDTTEFTPYLNQVINNAYIYQFAFSYTDENRVALNKLTNWETLSAHLDSKNILQQFVNYASNKGIKPNQAEIQQSKNFITTQLKAYIARNILGDEGFYPILFQRDIQIKRAIEELGKES